jgi:lysylphosphatidylglycerol synthetase-like protein (DUF2156 family)
MRNALSAQRVRYLLAVATAMAGAMNIVSSLFPAFHWRYLLLRDMVPLHVINDSQIATVVLGILLIMLADGLSKRHRRAMRLTLVLLAASAVVNITKGLDYEEALVSVGLAFALYSRRADYRVASRPIRLMSAVSFTAAFTLLYYAYAFLGFRLLEAWITPQPTLAGALLEPLRFVFATPIYHYHGHQAVWFGDSLIAVACVAMAITAALILRPLVPIHRSNAHDRERALRIIHAHGTDSLSYFALRDDRSYFFDDGGDAFLSYKIWRNVALVGGGPIGAPERCGPVTEQFLEFCEGNGLAPAILGSDSAHISMYRGLGLRVLKIGEESVIPLASFDVAHLKRKVRRAERHCIDLGVSCEVYSASELPEAYRRAAHEISHGWVKTKGGTERGFSMTLGRFPTQSDRHVRVLIATYEARLIGFLTIVPVLGANGWSLDMMRRDMDSPNGLTEYMVIQAARRLQSSGSEFLSLNFASLSSTEATIPEPRALTSLRGFLYENLSSVYQLKTLYQFNSKFEPDWASRYLVYGDLLRTGKVFMAVIQAEDPIRLSTLAGVLRRS